MKIFLKIIIASLFLANSISWGQNKDMHQRLNSYKIAFLTEKLNLSEKEAQEFWPIYNVYNEQKSKLYREERSKIDEQISNLGGIDALSEKQAKEILTKLTNIHKQKVELKNGFHAKISKFLPYKKMVALEMAEHKFHKKLARKLYRPKKVDK